MSDSRTTYHDRPTTDNTIKAVAYPLDRRAAAGEPVAVVMVAERSAFTPQDNYADPVQAADVVREALSDPPFGSVTELAIATWKALRERMFDCPDCQEARDVCYADEKSERWEAELDDIEAPGACGHDLEMHVVGFDPTLGARPVRYTRSWGSASADRLPEPEELPERTAFRSGFSAPEDRKVLDYPPSPPGQYHRLIEEMRQWFTQTAGQPKLIATIGGQIRTLVINPRTGINELPSWELGTSTP
ncbi:hypothetical protein [Nocardia sp. NPDC058705]|uniref:hypothetical protein n=1 Tax=Nocardia sp. NPDC058705 TaxID=3346609 RepID=UPI00368DA986